jgi:cysteine desulfurase/selenocysteine lyase
MQAFEVGGTPNFPGRVALALACELLNQIGRDRIAAHVTELIDELMDGLRTLDVTPLTPAVHRQRAGIVCFPFGDASRERQLVSQLRTDRIHVSQRYNDGRGGVRVSVHVYNAREDIERLLKAIERFKSV